MGIQYLILISFLIVSKFSVSKNLLLTGTIHFVKLSKSLGKRNLSQDNLEKALLYIFDHKVSLVEKKSDYKVARKKESTLSAN